jgi:hypothetical protein
MKKLVSALVLAGTFCAGSAQAQLMIDMRRITCADYLAMPADDATLTSAWLSGWFNQKMGYTTVDLNAYARNVENVTKWCGSNPKETVMSGLERSTAKQ